VPSTEETIDIETSGNAVALRVLGNNIVDVHVRGDAAADYAVDVRRNARGKRLEPADDGGVRLKATACGATPGAGARAAYYYKY
jgi:hypothetical protein